MRIRRRPTRRHRRNRLLRRAFLLAGLLSLSFGLCKIALNHLSPSLFRASMGVEPDRPRKLLGIRLSWRSRKLCAAWRIAPSILTRLCPAE
jgi:hypothetical protein